MKLPSFAFAFLLLTLLACGGSSTVVTPNTNALEYAAPVPYALPPGRNQPSYYNGVGHAVTYAAVAPSGQQLVFWSSPSNVQFVGPNELQIVPGALNYHDEIVGFAQHDGPNGIHAFYFNAGNASYIRLKETSDAIGSHATSINEKGEIVGVMYDSNFWYPVYWANKNADPVKLASDPLYFPLHIDDSGRILGRQHFTSEMVSIPSYASPTVVPYQGLEASNSISIRAWNAKGVVAGASNVGSQNPVATYWAPGSDIASTMPPVVGYPFATITAIAPTGFATGYFPNSFGTNSAFIFSAGSAIDLKNVTPNQDGWDFVTGIWVDSHGNLTVQGWKAGDTILLYLQRVK